MKKLLLVLLCCYTIGFSQSEKVPDRFIPSFKIESNDLELSRLAQPNQYFDKIGKRAGLMGLESGQFEVWVWPWKPLRNFELQFFIGTSTQPILAKDIVRTISVTPELTTLTYTYESFTVKEHILVPRDEPGAILLLDVHTTAPLSIIPGFIPVMQPMWPAGIGGQFSYWDEDVNGYVISEGQWRSIVVCGSPAGRQMAAPPAHMFADNPIQFRIDVKPGETDGNFIPIVIAGAIPDTVTWKMKYDSVKTTYNRLWRNAGKYYRENYEYYQHLRTSTMQILTHDKEIILAYEWGKVALDNLIITNPRLGTGMVAGFGLSGGGARPGFAWFFGGDAFINVLTLNSVGMFQQARDALAFTQKWQRQENYPIRKIKQNDPPKDVGKMAHELSQSDGLCDWWNDYRYGYNHADTTPWYLVAMGDYVRTSGDIEFLKESWKSVKQAYDWCLSKDSDGDGLMDLKGAGLGALEFGKLVGIYADVYTCGVWVQAIKEMKYMAELVGDSKSAKQAEKQFAQAQPQLEEKFWMEKEGFYSYGATEQGEQVHEKTPWSGVAMMFNLLDEERTAKSIEAFNSADLCTDWGVRTLSNKSALFDPTNYNYGAVWPFIGSFYNTAQFKHHYSLSAYQILQANMKHAFDHALGVVPEVFSGELNEKLGEGYHHQGFSTTGYMLPLVKGLLGLEVDGVGKTIRYTPHVPTFVGANFSLTNVRIGSNTIDVNFLNNGVYGKETRASIGVNKNGPDTISIIFSPSLDLGSKIMSAYVPTVTQHLLPGQPKTQIPYEFIQGNQDNHANVIFSLWEQTGVLIDYHSIGYIGLPGYQLMRMDTFVYDRPTYGSVNSGLRIISQRYESNMLYLTVEGLSGATYGITLSFLDAQLEGVERGDSNETITFDSTPIQQFVRKEVVIRLKQ